MGLRLPNAILGLLTLTLSLSPGSDAQPHQMEVRAVGNPLGSPVDPAKAPATTPPAGVMPDFDREEPLRYVLLATVSVCIVVCTVTMTLRLMARFFILKVADWSDCTCNDKESLCMQNELTVKE